MKRVVFAAIATAAILVFPVSVSEALPAKVAKPSWCHSVGFCWATAAAVEESIEKHGAPAPIGYTWTGTGTSLLRVNSASCIGVLRYGRVYVSARNIYETVDVSDQEWHDYANAEGPVLRFRDSGPCVPRL